MTPPDWYGPLLRDVCIIIALGLCLAGAAAHGQEPRGYDMNTSAGMGLHVTPLDAPRERDGALIEVVHHNRLTSGTEVETFWEFDTPHGELVLRLVTTHNAGCTPACPDAVEALIVPPGLIAVPQRMETPEGGVGVMILREWAGM